MEKQQKVIIEFKSDKRIKDTLLNEIADLIIKYGYKANMSFYENLNRTEYLNECD